MKNFDISPLFVEGQGPPFVSISTQYIKDGDHSYNIEQWTLNGTIIGCTKQELENIKKSILDKIGNDTYGTITVEGFGTLPLIQMNSVEFASSDYFGKLPYSISFTYYPTESFGSIFGVTEPTDTETVTTLDNGIIQAERNISARGILTSLNRSSAFDNAAAFVESRLGPPTASEALYLYSKTISQDRASNRVSASLVYKSANEGSFIHIYEKGDLKVKNEKDITTQKGNIECGVDGDIEGAISIYNAQKGGRKLISENYSMDDSSKTFQYSFSYYTNSNEEEPPIEEKYTISFSDTASSAIATASVNSRFLAINSCDGDGASSKAASANYLSIIDQLNSIFLNVTQCGDFNKEPLRETVTKSSEPTDLEAIYSAEYNTRKGVPGISNKFTSSVRIQKNWGKKIFVIKEGINNYICQDIQVSSRASQTCTVSQNGGGSLDLISIAESQLEELGSDIFEEEKVSEILEGDKSSSATVTKSYFGDVFEI